MADLSTVSSGPLAVAGLTAAPIKRRLLTGLGWSSLGRVAALLGSLALNAVLARILVPRDLGAYYLIIALTAFLATVSLLGLNQAVVRIVPEALTQNRPQDARGAAMTCLVVGAVSSSIVGLLLMVTAKPLAVHIFHSPAMAGAAVLVGLLVPVSAMRLLAPEVFRGLHDIRLASLFGDGATNASLAVAVGAIAVFAAHVRLTVVLIAALATAGVLTAWSLFRLRASLRVLPSGWASTAPTLRLALPMVAANLGWVILAQVDLLILGGFRSNADVAYYGAASRIASLLIVPLMVMNSVIAPVIPELWFSGRRAALQQLLQGVAAINSLLCGVGLLILIVAGGPILELLFGGFYGRGAAVLTALSIGAFINSAGGPCGLALILAGEQVAAMIFTVSIVIATTGAVVWAAGAYGALGVAVTMTCGVFAQNLGMVLLVRQRLGIWTFPSPRAIIRMAGRRTR